MEDAKENVKEKRKVQVINVPHKKKPLRTPTHFLRLAIVWSFIICIFLLTFPFLSATLYITDDLDTTVDVSKAYITYSSQEQIDNAADRLQKAFDNLKESKDKNETKSSSSVRALMTANYKWQYHVAKGVEYKKLQELILQSMNLDRENYTEESLKELNTATINAQKVLCATVEISQSAFQMMLGGSIGEAYGYDSGAKAVARSFFSFALAIMPVIGFFAASFDKHRNIKHIISLVCAIVCLSDIILMIYPYVGIGAVLSILMYFLICVLNIAGIYAKQQEDYIVKHPELEAEFTEKHPQFVKALINEKTFGKAAKEPTKKEREYTSAKNAKKRNNKKK